MKQAYNEFKDAEFIQFHSEDGLNLPGLLFNAKSDEAAIFLHGNGSSSVFYYNDYSMPRELLKKGIATLMFNNRGAHLVHKLDKYKDEGVERKRYGMAYELIDEIVFDIEGALKFLRHKGYKKFYLIGGSTGANKIVAYNKLKPKNPFSKYVLIAGGDDFGIYYNMLGEKKFIQLLRRSKQKIKVGDGDEIITDLLPSYYFSYKSFYDIANPEGSYNIFPYLDYFKKLKLTKKEKFNEFSQIKKSTLVVYGDDDEYAWEKVDEIIKLLHDIQPGFDYSIIRSADHGFTNQLNNLAKVVANWIDKKK